VSTEVSAAPRRGAPPRLPWILLILSVALNLFFIGGALWVRHEAWHAHLTPAERFEMVAQQSSLTGDERAAFERFIRTLRVHMRNMRESNEPLIQEIWGELAKEKPDDAVIDRDVDTTANNRHAFQVEASRAMRTFLAALTPEHRARFVELAKNRQNRDVPPLLRQLAP
jgi:uncharacterized membrane protein